MKNEADKDQCVKLLKHFIIELIGCLNNTNPKLRGFAIEAFKEVSAIMRVDLNSINQLFTTILVGLASKSQVNQAATVRALKFAIRENVVVEKEQ